MFMAQCLSINNNNYEDSYAALSVKKGRTLLSCTLCDFLPHFFQILTSVSGIFTCVTMLLRCALIRKAHIPAPVVKAT